MFARIFIFMTILAMLVSACTPAQPTDSREAIKNELQPILTAMLTGNVTDQLALIQYIEAECTNVPGFGGPPSCSEGVPEGTVIAGFPILGSEGYLASPEEMEGFLIDVLPKNLYAVYRVTPSPNDDAYFPVGEYAMLFEREFNDSPLPITLRVMDGKIVRLDYLMVNSLADALQNIPLEQIIISPQEAIAWSEQSR
ncbi:MAG TPA: hypothetical protein VJM08_12090 [Anaerolineales bacterium]|nr:hypothetical protein [Anaerolineales bacterium]